MYIAARMRMTPHRSFRLAVMSWLGPLNAYIHTMYIYIYVYIHVTHISNTCNKI